MNDDAKSSIEDGPAAGRSMTTALVPYAVRVNATLVRRGLWPKLRRMAATLPFAEDAVALWFCALDRETPAATKAMLLAALAWFVVPKPLRPRRLPVPGLNLADEAAVTLQPWRWRSAPSSLATAIWRAAP